MKNVIALYDKISNQVAFILSQHEIKIHPIYFENALDIIVSDSSIYFLSS